MINHFSALSILVPLAFALYRYRYLNNEMKLLFWFFLFSAIVEAIGYINASRKSNDLWLINSFVLIEGAVYFYLVGTLFEARKLFRLTVALFVVFAIVWAYTVFIESNIYIFSTKDKTLKGILLTIMSGYALIKISQEDNIVMMKDYRFWILSAILIYFSLTVVIFATADFVLENQSTIEFAWAFHCIINIISNLLFAIGFACSYRRSTLSG